MFRDNPILFSRFFSFFFCSCLQLILCQISRSLESVSNFPTISTTQISEEHTDSLSTTSLISVLFREMGRYCNPLRAPSRLQYFPIFFQLFNPIVRLWFHLLFRLVHHSDAPRTSIVYHGGHRRFRGQSGVNTSDLRETQPPRFLTNRLLYSSLRRDQIFFLLDYSFYSILWHWGALRHLGILGSCFYSAKREREGENEKEIVRENANSE